MKIKAAISAFFVSVVLVGCGSGAGTSDPSLIQNSGNGNGVNTPSVPVSQSVLIKPNHSLLRYTGRVWLSEEEALFDWPNTQIEFKTAASSVEILLSDGTNDFNVLVDDELLQVISTSASEQRYSVELGAGEHVVRVTKRNGSNFGQSRFLGLRLPSDSELLPLPAAPEHKIEFIGDSYTVGYGNEGPGLDCNGQLRPYENSYLSYAPITARALGAQSHSIAISGKGAVRNYGDENTQSADPLPSYYARTVAGREDTPWDFSRWVPDAVVIKLGTNDHSTTPVPPSEVFVQGVHDLIAQINDAYGQLPIVLLADNSLELVMQRMQTIQSEQVQMGNSDVHFVLIDHPPQSQLGCDWHPKVVAHEAMAEQLVEALKPILPWTKAGVKPVELNIEQAEVTPFKHDAAGAYSIILDDYCASWVSGIDEYAIPSMLEHGFRAGLGAIASECEKNHYEARLKEVSELGFEIVNHSWSHPALVPCDSRPNPNQSCSDTRPDLSLEIDHARDYLAAAIEKPVDFFIFPFNSIDNFLLNHLRAEEYLGARGGTYTVNSADFSDPFMLNYLGNQADMNAMADQAVNDGIFMFVNMHGVEDASYKPVALETWNNHVVHLAKLIEQHKLWVATPSEIIQYNRSRALCGTPTLMNGKIVFQNATPSCSEYVTGLTVKLTASDAIPDLAPSQGGVKVSVRRVSANTVLLDDIDPRYATELAW